MARRDIPESFDSELKKTPDSENTARESLVDEAYRNHSIPAHEKGNHSPFYNVLPWPVIQSLDMGYRPVLTNPAGVDCSSIDGDPAVAIRDLQNAEIDIETAREKVKTFATEAMAAFNLAHDEDSSIFDFMSEPSLTYKEVRSAIDNGNVRTDEQMAGLQFLSNNFTKLDNYDGKITKDEIDAWAAQINEGLRDSSTLYTRNVLKCVPGNGAQ